MSRYTLLSPDAPTSEAYPTRCPDCSRPIERLSVFPGGRCIDCHEVATEPITDARELARMWGAESGAMRLDSLAFLATVALVSVPVTLVTVFVGRLAGAVAGVA